jgi:hypothetical protein
VVRLKTLDCEVLVTGGGSGIGHFESLLTLNESGDGGG